MGSVVKTFNQISDTYLDNNKLLDSTELTRMGLTSGNFYGWNFDGISSFDGTEWNNGANLTQVGSIATAENHLGNTRYCDFGDNILGYHNGTALNDTGSFVAGAWVKIDTARDQTLMGKRGSSTFYWGMDQNGGTRLRIWSSNDGGGGGIVQVESYGVNELISNGQFHFICGAYNQTKQSLTLYVDGKIVAHKVDSGLASRANSASEYVAIGGAYAGGSPGGCLDGQISDAFYYKGEMTFDQIRQLYVAGTLKRAYLDGSRLRIQGDSAPYGWGRLVKSSNQSGAASWAIATDLHQYIPVSGVYRFLVSPESTGDLFLDLSKGASHSALRGTSKRHSSTSHAGGIKYTGYFTDTESVALWIQNTGGLLSAAGADGITTMEWELLDY